MSVKTIAECRERAKTYRDWNYENNAAYIMLGEGNELWARNDKPSPKWQLGQDQYFRLVYAAALR